MMSLDTSTFFPALADFLSPLNGQDLGPSLSSSENRSVKASSRKLGQASQSIPTSANSLGNAIVPQVAFQIIKAIYHHLTQPPT